MSLTTGEKLPRDRGMVPWINGVESARCICCCTRYLGVQERYPLGYKDESARCGDEIHCYPDAGHFITFPPGSSTQDSTAYYHPQYKVWLLMEGSPAGIAKAEREGNSALRAFLEKAFGE
jgi:hypothetical protein